MSTTTTTTREIRTSPEHQLDRPLPNLDAAGRLVLTSRRLPGGRVQLTIGAAPRGRAKAVTRP